MLALREKPDSANISRLFASLRRTARKAQCGSVTFAGSALNLELTPIPLATGVCQERRTSTSACVIYQLTAVLYTPFGFCNLEGFPNPAASGLLNLRKSQIHDLETL